MKWENELKTAAVGLFPNCEITSLGIHRLPIDTMNGTIEQPTQKEPRGLVFSALTEISHFGGVNKSNNDEPSFYTNAIKIHQISIWCFDACTTTTYPAKSLQVVP